MMKQKEIDMKLKLIRDTFSDESTIGKLYIDGQCFCETLEDKDRYLEAGGKKEYGKTCIPRGKYKVELSMSNRFKKLLPILINVPQFEGIRMHAGNTAADTDGCILLGRTRRNNFVENSRDAVNEFIQKLKTAIANGEECWIEVC